MQPTRQRPRPLWSERQRRPQPLVAATGSAADRPESGGSAWESNPPGAAPGDPPQVLKTRQNTSSDALPSGSRGAAKRACPIATSQARRSARRQWAAAVGGPRIPATRRQTSPRVTRPTHLVPAVSFVLLLGACAPFAADAPPVTAQRPLLLSDTATVPLGEAEAEVGVRYDHDDDVDVPSALKLGVGEGTELFFE